MEPFLVLAGYVVIGAVVCGASFAIFPPTDAEGCQLLVVFAGVLWPLALLVLLGMAAFWLTTKLMERWGG